MRKVDIGVLVILLASVTGYVVAPCFDKARVHAATFSHCSQRIFTVIDTTGQVTCARRTYMEWLQRMGEGGLFVTHQGGALQDHLWQDHDN